MDCRPNSLKSTTKDVDFNVCTIGTDQKHHSKQEAEMKETKVQDTELAICDFTGKVRNGYRVERSNLVGDSTASQKKQIGHHIIIVDRSGSMYYDINALKENLIQVLTLDQFLNTGLKVSLISYSGQGDVTLHFSGVPIDEVMTSNSEYIADIKKIRATYLTCISQAMQMAKGLINDDEITGISLHSDGFANDRSSYSEKQELSRICEEMQGKNVFVNTIAYSERSDFQLLSQVANSVSGSAVLARSPKEVYLAFLASAEAVSSGTAVTVDLPIGSADYQIFVDSASKRIIGSSHDLSVKGVDPQNGSECYVLRYSASSVAPPTLGTSRESRIAAYAYARAMVAAGDINKAKYAMNSALNPTLTAAHARALTSVQLGEMCGALEDAVFRGDDTCTLSKTAKFAQDGISIIELCGLLAGHRKDILVNRLHLEKNYKRRGLKRVRGSRDENGVLTEPWLDTEYLDNSDFVQMGTLNVNTNTATVNMNIARPIRLVEKSGRKPVTEVAGIMLNDLQDFKNYTIVGDGEVNVPNLEVRFSSKEAFQAFADAGVVTGNAKYSHSTVYSIDLSSMPVCPYDIEVAGVSSAFRKLAAMKVVSSILSASIKGESAAYSTEQLEELKRHYLSASLYVNFPTTNEYTDLEEAMKNGKVDTRVSYRIDIGDTDILNMSKFTSANAFLQRIYEADGIEKPTMDLNLDKNTKWSHKKLSARTKITAIDNFMKPIFDAFLGLGPVDPLADVLVPLGCIALLDAVKKGEKGDELVPKIERAAKVVDEASSMLWREAVCPLVFYIGSTGLVPDELGLEMKTAEELQTQYPELKLAKKELEGSFFVSGNLVVSVYATNEHYSTGN